MAWGRGLFSLLGVAALAALSVRAQSDSIQCATNCAEVAAEAVGCIGTNSAECICLSQTFLTLATDCILLSCTTAVQQQAQQNYDTQCAPFKSGSSTLVSTQSAGTGETTAPVTLTITATIGGTVSTITTAINPVTDTSSAAVQTSSQNTISVLPPTISPTAASQSSGSSSSSSSSSASPTLSISAAKRVGTGLNALQMCAAWLWVGGLVLGGLAVL